MADDLEPYIGETRVFAFGHVPRGWAACDGQELSISENLALFSLLGTAFGGNGSTKFKLPDLRGRVPMHASLPTERGQSGGSASHTLTLNELPRHNHQLIASNARASTSAPVPGMRMANSQPGNLYGPANNLAGMDQVAIGVTGESLPHENRQPYLVLNICICLAGEFPSKPTEEES